MEAFQGQSQVSVDIKNDKALESALLACLQASKKKVEKMSAEIIDRLEQRNLELEIVAYNAMHSENLLIEWAAMPERNTKPRPNIEERMLIAAREIEARRGLTGLKP